MDKMTKVKIDKLPMLHDIVEYVMQNVGDSWKEYQLLKIVEPEITEGIDEVIFLKKGVVQYLLLLHSDGGFDLYSHDFEGIGCLQFTGNIADIENNKDDEEE